MTTVTSALDLVKVVDLFTRFELQDKGWQVIGFGSAEELLGIVADAMSACHDVVLVQYSRAYDSFLNRYHAVASPEPVFAA